MKRYSWPQLPQMWKPRPHVRSQDHRLEPNGHTSAPEASVFEAAVDLSDTAARGLACRARAWVRHPVVACRLELRLRPAGL